MPTVQYRTNLNCGSCIAAVRPHLDSDPTIHDWSVDTDNPDKILSVEGSDGVSEDRIRRHLSAAGFELLGEVNGSGPAESASAAGREEPRSFLVTYRPLLLVLAYLLGIVALVEIVAGSFDGLRAMRVFMGGFFVAFSFFKLLDLAGFVTSFQTYDILARRSTTYGYAYPFIELLLGILYLLNVAPLWVNGATILVMVIGLIGVSQALLQRREIQCACLGTVFNLPMSKVTFIEDALMAAMAAAMIAML